MEISHVHLLCGIDFFFTCLRTTGTCFFSNNHLCHYNVYKLDACAGACSILICASMRLGCLVLFPSLNLASRDIACTVWNRHFLHVLEPQVDWSFYLKRPLVNKVRAFWGNLFLLNFLTYLSMLIQKTMLSFWKISSSCRFNNCST